MHFARCDAHRPSSFLKLPQKPPGSNAHKSSGPRPGAHVDGGGEGGGEYLYIPIKFTYIPEFWGFGVFGFGFGVFGFNEVL